MASTPLLEQEPVAATEEEQTVLAEIERLLCRERAHHTKLVGPDGEQITLPESAFRVLREVVHQLAQQQAIMIVPIKKELTTQQAADLLNVSRPFLITLLERGEIPYGMVGTHRRIKVGDLVAYKERRDATRRQALKELTRLSDELSLYK